MAGQYPAPLPSLGLNLAPSSSNVAGAPAYLPSIGLVLGTTGGRSPLSATAGAFVLTGQAAALKSGRKVASAAGSFSEAGVAATLTKASPGFGMGAPAPLPSLSLMLERSASDPLMAGASGSFVLTGVAPVLLKGRGIAAGTARYIVNGAPAQRDLQLTADKATFADTGVAAVLTRASQGITANRGAFVLTGFAAGLIYQTSIARTLAAQFGIFTLTGIDATLPTTIARKLICDRGSFVLTGNAADLHFVGWVPINSGTGTWTNVSQASTTWTGV